MFTLVHRIDNECEEPQVGLANSLPAGRQRERKRQASSRGSAQALAEGRAPTRSRHAAMFFNSGSRGCPNGTKVSRFA